MSIILVAGIAPFFEPLFTALFYSIPFWLSWNCVLQLLPYHLPHINWHQTFSMLLLVRIIMVLGGGIVNVFTKALTSMKGT
jgi:hypothetical protein